MTPAELKSAYQAFGANQELTPDDPRYVPLVETDPQRDPIRELATRLGFEDSESVHLLTGFRGNGKSTQLRRLEQILRNEGHTVFRIDLLEWMPMSTPVELSDFLLSVIGALDDARRREGHVTAGDDAWTRFVTWMGTRTWVEGGEVAVNVGVASLKANLKTDPTFREQLQAHLRGQVANLVRAGRQFVSELVDAVRAETGDPHRKVVLLVDSFEQQRGDGVVTSAQTLFVTQAENLRFPKLHVVYTFPPSLLPLAQNLGRLHGCVLTMWPNVHVRMKSGGADPAGLELLRTVVARRFPRFVEILDAEQLDALAAASGGDIRDFFRLVREVVIGVASNSAGRADPALLTRVIGQLRSELLPIADDDATWLARIRKRHDVALDSVDHVSILVRLFDNNLIMNYRNGEAWYDVHPLVVDRLPPIPG